jgi:hypothetical protein
MNTLECGMVLFFLTVMGVLLYMNYRKTDGFLNGSAVGTAALQCGVEFPACPMGMRCVNGYCASTDPPTMPPVTDLPVLPIGPINGRWPAGEVHAPLKD